MRADSPVSPASSIRRKRRRYDTPLPRSVVVLDVLIALLLLTPATIGVVLFGAVRTWSIAPLMLSVFAAAALSCLRAQMTSEAATLRIPPGGVMAIGFVLVGLLMIPSALVPYDAWINFLKVASYVAAFWTWCQLCSRPDRWRWPLAIVIFVATLISWYAIIQHAQGTRMVLTLERPETYGMRASGTYMCPNHFASLLEILTVACFVLVQLRASGAVLRILAGYAMLVFVPTLYLTQSRSGWIGLAVGLVVTTALLAYRKGTKRAMVFAVSFPLMLAFIAAALWFSSPMVQQRVKGALLSSPDSAVAARLAIWKDTKEIIKDKPLLGHGPGSYRWVYPQFKTNSYQYRIRYAHNEYLHWISEYGAIGFIWLAATVGMILWFLLRQVKHASRQKEAFLSAAMIGALCSSLAHACFDFNFHLFSVNHVLILLCAAAISGPYVELRAAERYVRPAGLVTALIALGLVIASALAFFAYGFHHRGEQLRKAFKMDEARTEYFKSMKCGRSNWEPYVGVANTYQAESFWNIDDEKKQEQAGMAIDFYLQGLERNPMDISARFGLHKAYASSGDDDRALAELKFITDHARNYVFYMGHYGKKLREMGHLDEASQVLREARKHEPSRLVDLQLRMVEEALQERKIQPAGAEQL